MGPGQDPVLCPFVLRALQSRQVVNAQGSPSGLSLHDHLSVSFPPLHPPEQSCKFHATILAQTPVVPRLLNILPPPFSPPCDPSSGWLPGFLPNEFLSRKPLLTPHCLQDPIQILQAIQGASRSGLRLAALASCFTAAFLPRALRSHHSHHPRSPLRQTTTPGPRRLLRLISASNFLPSCCPDQKTTSV